jgi:hypothetical protein|mmetsp:Transcript_44735/g.118680  ORF Transcript_44735/g.118680 Transcript_44735/m.118680 type:complete len:124 (-) Transcript_44735:549-920(-)
MLYQTPVTERINLLSDLRELCSGPVQPLRSDEKAVAKSHVHEQLDQEITKIRGALEPVTVASNKACKFHCPIQWKLGTPDSSQVFVIVANSCILCFLQLCFVLRDERRVDLDFGSLRELANKL